MILADNKSVSKSGTQGIYVHAARAQNMKVRAKRTRYACATEHEHHITLVKHTTGVCARTRPLPMWPGLGARGTASRRAR